MSDPVTNLPPRDAGFVGRADSLDRIRTALAAGGRVRLHGPVGAGTTSLALEHARRHLTDYDVIWLVPAGEPALTGGHLAGAAYAAGLVEPDVTTPAAVAAVHRAVAAGGRWLLIFDDAPAGFGAIVPPTGGHVIVTGQAAFPPVEVGFFRREESAGLLRQRVAALTAPAADQLAAALGDRPLAVTQAATLLTFDPAADATPSPVRAVIDRLDAAHPAAAQLLCLHAVLGAAPVPADVLAGTLHRMPGPLGAVPPAGFSGLEGALAGHGLRPPPHPLVRAAVLGELGDAAAEVCRRYAGDLVTAALPDAVDDPAAWPRWTALAPHLLAARPAAGPDPGLREAGLRFVRLLLRRAEPQAAREVVTGLHESWRRDLGPDHPHTLAAAAWRAHTLLTLGAAREAVTFTADAATRCRAVLGDENPVTLHVLDEHAAAVAALGHYAGGRDLHRAVGAVRAALLGPDHPDTLRSAVGESRCLNLLGDPAAALPVGEDALARAGRTLGPDHPDTLRAATEPIVSLAALGRTAEAHRCCTDTLARRRRVLGDDHPQTLTAAHCLAAVLHVSGDRAEGRRMHQEVLARRTAALGPDHPDTLRSAFAVSVTLLTAGALLPARALLDETLDRLVTVLGPNHPLTRNVRERRRQASMLMGGVPHRGGSRKKGPARKRKRS